MWCFSSTTHTKQWNVIASFTYHILDAISSQRRIDCCNIIWVFIAASHSITDSLPRWLPTLTHRGSVKHRYISNRSLLNEIMARHVFGSTPLSEPMLDYKMWIKIQQFLYRKIDVEMSENGSHIAAACVKVNMSSWQMHGMSRDQNRSFRRDA